ncbi:MAG: ATP-dependent RecD-like DNA helicase [Alphaproteobacteria bacterium]|nr:ATP-dependent RecD-like DNA helicase [Alphaproteobacteria bacterium]
MNQNNEVVVLEAISGLVERITFQNPENGYCVLRIKARGHRELITVVGHSSSISAGEFLQASGAWVNNKIHGPQFKAVFLKASAPTTEEGIEKYLGSGMVKGIGPVYAKKLVQAFGTSIFEVIEETPEKLQTLEGIGPHRMTLIAKGWADQKAVREIMLFLHQYGVSTARAVRIYKTFGANAIQAITENPYRLAREIRGIGFLSADKIAQKIGIDKDSLIRAQAGLNHTLLESMDQGHCALPVKDLLTQTQALLETSQDTLEKALNNELEAGDLIQDSIRKESCIFLKGLYHSEQSIAHFLKSSFQGLLPWGEIDADKAITWVEGKLSLILSQSQKDAIHKALTSKVLTITGGPGVGKTTLVKSLLAILSAKGIKTALCAPTGRAAKRLSECTGQEAKTIHRLLEVDPTTGKFRREPQFPLNCELLIVDEVSMIDVPLMFSLLKALPQEAGLFLIGDVDQLPSVGPGNVLSDIIHSSALPVVRLSEIFRQAASSKIILNAHRINKGLFPKAPQGQEESDFYFIDAQEPEDAARKIIEVVKRRVPQRFGYNSLTEIQVLCPMNRGTIGARHLNMELQKALNPNPSVRVERFGWTFCLGDKVMQVVNNYDKETYNGDIGFITDINSDVRELTITFENREVLYDFDELDEVVLAYVTTIHKAQGSEYPVVVIPIMMQHYPMLKRNLLYTGVTRGKQLVVLIGQKKALGLAVREKTSLQRWSKLREWLS